MPAVYVLDIAHVERIEHPRKAFFIMGNHDKVNMVAHEAVREDIKPVLLRILVHPHAVLDIIVIVFKDILAVVAPLGNMVGDIRNDDA